MERVRPSDPSSSPHRRSVLTWLASGAVAWTTHSQAADPSAAGPYRTWPRGRATPALQLNRLDGTPWSLKAARGRVVLLNFWASWCEPCRDELPALQALQGEFADRGLDVVAVNYKEQPGTIRTFVDRTRCLLPVVRDAEGSAARTWGVWLFPTTVAIARDGRARFSVLGEIDWHAQAARQWVSDLL